MEYTLHPSRQNSARVTYDDVTGDREGIGYGSRPWQAGHPTMPSAADETCKGSTKREPMGARSVRVPGKAGLCWEGWTAMDGRPCVMTAEGGKRPSMFPSVL